LSAQIRWRADLISAIESFLVSNWPDTDEAISQGFAVELAKGTLAFHLADDAMRDTILSLFQLLSDNVADAIRQLPQLKHFGRTLYGLHDARAISGWLNSHIEGLRQIQDRDELVDYIWPLLGEIITNKTAQKLTNPEFLPETAKMWAQGHSYDAIWNFLKSSGVKLTWGSKFRSLTIQHIVNLCDGAFSFDGTLIIGAIIELIDQQQTDGDLDGDDDDQLIERLQLLLKALKYGLPNETSIAIHEIGFSDRVVALQLYEALGQEIGDKDTIKLLLRAKPDISRSWVSEFPSFYADKMDGIIRSPS
jgi:POLQ-like helicase